MDIKFESSVSDPKYVSALDVEYNSVTESPSIVTCAVKIISSNRRKRAGNPAARASASGNSPQSVVKFYN